MCGCLALYIITFYRLGPEVKERIGAETEVSFFPFRGGLQAVSGGPEKARGVQTTQRLSAQTLR